MKICFEVFSKLVLGSNTHNNQGGGDGQADDDGEGKGGKKTALIIQFLR